MIRRINTTQPTAPCGRAGVFGFTRTGLNLAINAMVASGALGAAPL